MGQNTLGESGFKEQPLRVRILVTKEKVRYAKKFSRPVHDDHSKGVAALHPRYGGSGAGRVKWLHPGSDDGSAAVLQEMAVLRS